MPGALMRPVYPNWILNITTISGAGITVSQLKATSPKQEGPSVKLQASSSKILERQAYIIKFFRNSAKLQAVSIKLQAASSKLLDQ